MQTVTNRMESADPIIWGLKLEWDDGSHKYLINAPTPPAFSPDTASLTSLVDN